ncbi:MULTISPECIES: hypothetical protein [Rossellomorea]|jgi:hypothetical protein|uniref:hypothetical protein n=1 Tax=Rossellomorea TaxID=2837508 RepID=UPI0009CB60A4|nr:MULTISPECIES: hypothetical protein [Rossellomorea]PRX66548.1 hypothetical protein B0G93_13237 [Bacillus sp. V-88]MCA0147864.1 hypothetical protein [Rossellomorea vietnamensis]MCC5800453.1 hypothetical protein [Rossellomorea vietnamensis]UTE76100.1 hypothetical protein M1J35_16115 [Rossellomorea sp. KS-H15a]WGG43940.1 hypothetical protein P8596_14200 [Rossellomorea sp. DA94]
MDHSFIDFHKIYQALQSSISSISGEEAEAVHLDLHEASKNLDQAFQYELLKKRIYD